MGVKNKITGEMADLIVTLRNDQKVNYTFQDIKDQLEKRFNKTISINSIRLCYLKNAKKDIKEVVSNSNESITLEVKKEIKPVLNEVKQVKSLENNSSSLKTKVATQDQIADLDEQLKNFK